MGATPLNAAIAARDLAVVWHPCTQMQDHERLPPVPISRGEGVWLYDFEGRRYFDGISSWWVNLFGHANPRISAAVCEQAGRLEHVMLAGFTHAPVVELSEALVKIVPAGLTRCFFADNGSAAVEVAVKMSFHYWQNLGKPASGASWTLSNSYHGETLGALAVGDVELYKKVYQPLLMGRDHRCPRPTVTGASREIAGNRTAAACSRTWRRRSRRRPTRSQR
jgi:adenosylmethionine-8-amino-7-oxononanoate aminotransferase